MIKLWGVGTSRQYGYDLNRWFEYCHNHQIDPWNATLSNGADLLIEYFFESNCDYSSVNKAHPVLSAIFSQ